MAKGRVLDTLGIPARYLNSRPEGAPFEHYGPHQSDEAISYAGEIVEFARFSHGLTRARSITRCAAGPTGWWRLTPEWPRWDTSDHMREGIGARAATSTSSWSTVAKEAVWVWASTAVTGVAG